MEDLLNYVLGMAKAQYCDVRLESFQNVVINSINNKVKKAFTYTKKGMGVRILSNGAWGFASTQDLSRPALKQTVDIARKMAEVEGERRKEPIQLAEIPICEDTVDVECKIDFRELSLEEIIQGVLQWNQAIQISDDIVRAITDYASISAKKYFWSSEGTKIKFIRPIVNVNLGAVAKGTAGIQAYYEPWGGTFSEQGGTGGHEILGKDGDLTELCNVIGQKAIDLANAKPAPTIQDTPIVFDPSYMALLVHEIIGHPSEADRVLGWEAAWAGSTWWKGKSADEGNPTQIGSKYVTIYNDPTIPNNFAYMMYDDEGTPCRKATLVNEGILTERLHSRETAFLMGGTPNGTMRANTYEYHPIIRQINVYWGKGDWKADEIIEETKSGVLLKGANIPSIDDQRFNWAISSQEGYLIKNGEVTDHLYGCIATATTPAFLQSIDALAGDDQRLFWSSCGKGDPLQGGTVSNGGPTMRGIATLKGP
ncbi:MAG: TldD/PmbA family protein [Candidatus Thorarchaeota archaeon]